MSTIADIDRDAPDILPLALFPFRTTGLQGARMIKNARLESVIEIFKDDKMGSGQVDVDSIGTAFGWERNVAHPDFPILRKLASLPSYDMYSLRILLKEHDIPVRDADDLDVSESKKRELVDYMREFTEPLIVNIYGGTDAQVQSLADMTALFHDPDLEKTRARLVDVADKLDIPIEQVPVFFHDYGEVFLSVCYYRQCLDVIKPAIVDFFNSIDEINNDWKLRHDRQLLKICEQIRMTIDNMTKLVAGRFETVESSTKAMWAGFNAERFREVEDLIESNHTVMGGVLCALTVKMNAWTSRFPDSAMAGPIKRADFIISDMRQGFETLRNIKSGPTEPTRH